MTIELVFERDTPCKSEFERWRKAHFVPNRPTQLIEETYVS
jgi:hypothetical protein